MSILPLPPLLGWQRGRLGVEQHALQGPGGGNGVHSAATDAHPGAPVCFLQSHVCGVAE